MRGLRQLLSAGLVWLCVLVGGLVFGGVPALAVTKHVFSSSFGSFTGPVGIGVDRVSGAVYVADAEGLAVDRFDGTGEALSPSQMSGVSFGEPYGLAVDNSGGITQGDVYVADIANGTLDRFNGAGEFLSQITGLTSPAGVAVDGEGNVYVAELGGTVVKFNVLGEPDPANPIVSGLNTTIALAVDGEGDIYVGTVDGTIEYSGVGACVNECAAVDPGGLRGLAVDGANDVYVENGTSIAQYGPAGALVERFGEGHLSEGFGIAAGAAGVYVADYAGKAAVRFVAVELPEPVTGAVSNIAAGGAKLHGTVNPAGPEATCAFEYGPSEEYGQSVPCTAGVPGGSEPVAVEADLAGLEPNRTYHYRLAASNENGTNRGSDLTFVTLAAPATVVRAYASNVAPGSVDLGGQVNPNGSDTTYYFQYGTTAGYGSNTPAPPGADIGEGRSDRAVGLHLQGLQAGAVYHYRLVAIDSAGTSVGSDRTFRTPVSEGPFALPDNRAWEMVSPPEKNGGNVQPDGGLREPGTGGGLTEQSAVDGEAIAFESFTAFGDAHSAPFVSWYLARRGVGGWSTQGIDPLLPATAETQLATGTFGGFSGDLSFWFFQGLDALQGTGAVEDQENVYLRDNTTGSFRLLSPGTTTGVPYAAAVFAGASADFSHVVFVGSGLGLTPNALRERNYYEWVDGQLRLVNILPDGTPAEGLGIGGPEANEGTETGNASHAVSDDGSRIFWTDKAGAQLFVREDGERTVKISPGSERDEFFAANRDGSMVAYKSGDIYSAGDVYVDDVDTGQATDLTPGGSVVGFVGASGDLSYIYFVAQGDLTGGARAGQNNLYVLHHTGSGWTTSLIAELAAPDSARAGYSLDGNDWGYSSGPFEGLTATSAEVSSDGRYVVFMSALPLTGYDNTDARTGRPDSEVFMYDAVSGGLSCVSCNPTGGRPSGASSVPRGSSKTYQPRYLSSDGGRVFFDSVDALAGRDTNGQMDVYEWERDGAGICRMVDGCVYLLSSGTSSDASTFADASVSGDDLFFTTRSQLSPTDTDDSIDLYDAHVCSDSSPCHAVSSDGLRSCSGEGCLAPVLAPPVFGAGASATFSGAGNLVASREATKPKAKAKGKAKPKKRKAVKRRKKKAKKRTGRSRSAKSLSGGVRR